jgi:carbamoyltransferase
MVRLAAHAVERGGSQQLCMAGGVALNCVANQEILRRTPVERLFVQPAAGDAGGALGAALDIHYGVLGNPRSWKQETAAYGPSFSDEEIGSYLRSVGVNVNPLDRKELLREVAAAIARQEVVGWFQDRMEWGPRALGYRSILADPRNPENQRRVNLKVKFRESFRPFAPAVPEEDFDAWFEGPRNPYMLVTAVARNGRERLPSTTHVDGSARVQCVSQSHNPLFHALLREYGNQTGCPVVINTSFNVRGEPIVCTPADALRCFANTQIDSLALGRYFLRKPDIAGIDLDRFGTIAPGED